MKKFLERWALRVALGALILAVVCRLTPAGNVALLVAPLSILVWFCLGDDEPPEGLA